MHYSNMLNTAKLSWHAVAQSEAREVRHAIPAGSNIDNYPSMQFPHQRSGRLDTLSQHAAGTNHRSGNLDMLSQHTQCRHTIPACNAKSKLHKKGCKSPEQQTS